MQLVPLHHELNHTGRTIDVFKIDCEGCEWNTYNIWFEAPVGLYKLNQAGQTLSQ
jgi:hypothetical protein